MLRESQGCNVIIIIITTGIAANRNVIIINHTQALQLIIFARYLLGVPKP